VRWLAKANEAAKAGATVVCLLPVRTETHWWRDYVAMHEVEFLPGHLRFCGGKYSAPFASAIVIMRPAQPASGPRLLRKGSSSAIRPGRR
jgi:site-specific DNA-methyltransferase (adenine-specific)